MLVIAVGINANAQVSFASNDNETEIQVDMYPNPAVSYININLQLIPDTDVNPVLEIYNVLGNKIKTDISEQSRRSYRVSLDNLPAGYYFVSIKIPDSDIYKRLNSLNARIQHSLEFLGMVLHL